ncbi:MAG: hypothetical protein H6872_08660 [Methylobacteriaceae bacterium]|nr:hypothetical protein [Methylobacteriaceae bacterium]
MSEFQPCGVRDAIASAKWRASGGLAGCALALGLLWNVGTASAQAQSHVGFRPIKVAGVNFSSLDLQYSVKDGLATAAVACVARADKGRGKRISVDFFALENDNEPAIIAAQSQRGLQVSDTSDAICWSTSAPIADPHRKPSAMRVKVTNFDTGEFTEVDLTPLERAGRRRRHRR